MILNYLQKPFDTVNHDILIKKMEFIGFSEETAILKNTFSEPGKLICGLLQESILRPLLFLLNINNMPQAADCKLLLYVDDTCLMFQHNDITETERALNQNFSMLYD